MLFKLVDDSFHALLELSTILGSSHQRGQVETQQAFAIERPRHTPFANTDSKAFGNGTLAHTALTNEDRVVFLPTAENLCDAIHLFLSADDGVEFTVLRQFGEITAECLQGRSTVLALPVFGLAFPTFCHRVGKGIVDIVVAGLAAKVCVAGRLQATIATYKFSKAIVVNTIAIQHTGHQIIVFLQHGQDEVLGSYVGRFEFDAFQITQSQYFLGLSQHGNFTVGSIAYVALCLTHLVLQPFTESGCIDAKSRQHGHGRALGQTGHAKEKVFNADAAVFQTDSLVAAEGYGLPCIIT